MRRIILILILALVPAIPVVAADCNGNGIDDSQETLIRAGDYDYDADVDLDDFAALAANLAGPGQPLPDPQCAAMLLGAFDADTDGDLDLLDFAAFQRNFTGPHEPESYIRYATGYPDNIEWVEGGWVMSAHGETSANWQVSAFEFTIAAPTVITSIAGVGGHTGGAQGIPFVNIFSSLDAFKGAPLSGDIHSQVGEILGERVPFGFAGQGWDWQNYYYRYDFEPFLLEQAGTYTFSVAHDFGGQFHYAESTQVLGPSAWIAFEVLPGQVFEYTSSLGFATGTEAIDIKGYPVP